MAGQGPCDDYYGNVAPVPTLASQEPGGGATLPLAILPSCRAAQPRLSAKFDCWEMDGDAAAASLRCSYRVQRHVQCS